MRKIYFLIFFLLNLNLYSQSLSIFDIDTTGFPTMKASFYAFDNAGYPMTNLSSGYFDVKENEQQRPVYSVDCADYIPPIDMSSVLVIDVSGSMFGKGLDIAKSAAKAWINLTPTSKSECAITSFSNYNYLNQDFTTDKTLLLKSLNTLTDMDGTDYNAAMISPMAGGILIAKTGQYKRVIVFLTDGNPNFEPKTSTIINEAKRNKITIYCVSVGMKTPQCMKDFATETGGLYFENVGSMGEAEACYQRIFMTAQNKYPCELVWQSKTACEEGITKLDVEIQTTGAKFSTNFQFPRKAFAKLEAAPWSLKITTAAPGIKKDTTIKITAKNADVEIKNIISSNPAFTVSPKSFYLTSGQSKDLKISFTPKDSSYQSSQFTIENSLCEVAFQVKCSFKGVKFIERAITITHPNGGEVFGIGSDTIITWKGSFPSDTITLEYSLNGGNVWKMLTNKATGYKYIWRNLPIAYSNSCLVRGTVNSKPFSECDNGEIIIGNQIWMCRNLDVLTYRNGDTINHHEDSARWTNLKKGAWCYYNNDMQLGKTYGKLYNLMAVTDPRGLAPKGWHIPSVMEWDNLWNYLSVYSSGGGRLKSTGTIAEGSGLWQYPNFCATNETGFTGLPGGCRSSIGNFQDLSLMAYFWSSSNNDSLQASAATLYYDESYLAKQSYYKNNGFSVRCISDMSYFIIKSDTCDDYFSIRAPYAEVQDIDMKKCLIGDTKDSLIKSFIVNKGGLKVRIDSIYFRGKDSSAFSLVSGFPKYYVPDNESASAEIRFIPLIEGVANAEIVIITQSDSIIRKIKGRGEEPLIAIGNKVIDFGKVVIGFTMDTLQVLTIKNISTVKIHILSSKHGKPNDYDFTNGEGGAFDLAPHESKKMDLKFKPSAIGRTSGVLEFEYNSEGSPATIQLFGEGVMANTQELLSPKKDTINIPIDCQFKWRQNIPETAYNLQVSVDTNFNACIIDTAIIDTSFNCPGMEFFKRYYWRVNQGDAVNHSDWSHIWSFTTLMDSVNLTEPTNLTKNLRKPTSFSWEAGIYKKNYRFQILEDKDFSILPVNELNSQIDIAVSNLKFFTNYFWRVRNEIGDTLGYWSKIWQFKTGMSDILLRYPEDKQTGLEEDIEFKWYPVIGAQYYQLQISKNYNFTNLVYSMDSLKNITQFVKDLEPEVKYYWRVRVWNEECVGSAYWSDVWEYTTGSSSVKDKSEFIKIIPNPAGDFITILLGEINPMLKHGVDGTSEINIYNTYGKKVMSVELVPSSVQRININDLPNGIYFVRIGIVTVKFVKF